MSEEKPHLYEFGPFRLDAAKHLLFRNGEMVPLTPKVFDTLRVLVERSGEQVTKDQLMSAVWEDAIVEETNLTTNVSHLRKALGEKKNEHQYILTIPGEGYRFVAAVKAVPAAPAVPLPVSAAPIKSIAILPFKPLVADNRDESLELGMAETLITRLSGLKEVVVRPTSAVRRYNSLEQDAIAAGRELQVESVLDGNLQRAGDRLRVTVRLVRVADGQTLWAESFDESFTDVFAVQDAVAARVVGLLAVKLTGQEQMLLTKRYTQNPEAYQLYLKGRYFWNKFTPADHQRAAEYFNQAIGKDPTYAQAYTGLADTYAASAVCSWIAPSEGYPKAKAAAKRALQLDGTLSEAHASFGAIAMFYDLDWATAEREYKRAIDLNPNYPTVYELYSYLQSATGRLDEAIETAKHGLETDPLSVLLREDTGLAYYLARRYDEAIQQYQQSIQMDPNYAPALTNLGIVYEQKGMYDEAIAAYQKAINASERTSGILAALGHTYAVSGRRDEALKVLDELKEMSRQKYVSPYDLAVLYTGLGENDRAIEQLGKAHEERAGWIIYLKVNPLFDPLRSDPRFADLVRRVGLPQ
ncbi:MAG: tetratricopeptide repeat protein [Rubrivivax sp.]|nr:tetratricopeptide repeat protein [Pyrinomonadaceae bacterium]